MNCANCKFFKQNPKHEDFGKCKRFPPQFTVETSYSYAGEYSRGKAEGVHSTSNWPTVKKFEDWCGEFKGKIA